MSRCLSQFVKTGPSLSAAKANVTVLVATSGDTGGAVADGFCNVEGIDVVILYPSGKVSPVQEKQLTAAGKNVHALEVGGTFDDCQQMVKQAFADAAVTEKIFLTSANSINVARWLPQQFYYFFAYKQWKEKDQRPVICVPSGNFGNICAGMLAYVSGLPVEHFIAACNVNDAVPQYLLSGSYQPRPAHATYSNAMDVGNPSNFIRIMELFHQQYHEIKTILSAYSINDEETFNTIRNVYKDYQYTLDPHGAVGYLSLEKYLASHPDQKGIFLETAHPVKFPEVVEEAIQKRIEIPEQLRELMQKEKKAVFINPDYELLKEYLMSCE